MLVSWRPSVSYLAQLPEVSRGKKLARYGTDLEKQQSAVNLRDWASNKFSGENLHKTNAYILYKVKRYNEKLSKARESGDPEDMDKAARANEKLTNLAPYRSTLNAFEMAAGAGKTSHYLAVDDLESANDAKYFYSEKFKNVTLNERVTLVAAQAIGNCTFRTFQTTPINVSLSAIIEPKPLFSVEESAESLYVSDEERESLYAMEPNLFPNLNDNDEDLYGPSN